MIEGWKETEIGLVPDEWEQSILAVYAEKPQYGFTDSSSNSGNAKFLRITDITDTGVNWDDVPYCNCPDIEKYKLVNGDIVFARIGATTGKSYIINNPPKAVFASYLIRVRTKENLLSSYLIYFFNSEYYWRQINSQKGNNLKGGVNGSILSDLKIIVPPISEQRKIAYVLSTVQKAIEQQDKLIRHTTELKKALMQKLFTEGTKGEKQKQTEIGLVPESWEVVEFPRFALLQRGKDLTKSEFKDGNTPVAGSNGIIGYHNSSFVEAPGVTIGRSGTCGKPQYYNIDFWAHNTSLYVKDFFGNDEHFAFYYFEYLDLGRFKTGASVPTLDRNSLNTLMIGVPSKNEQLEIAKILTLSVYKLEFHQKKKQTLADLLKTLLHELMTGQRRVHEIDFPVTEDLRATETKYKTKVQTLSIATEK